MTNNKDNKKEETKKSNQDDTVKQEIMSEEHIAPEIDTTETESQQDLNSQIQEITNKYLRSLADTENLKKRNEKNMQDTRNFALVSFAKELLVVLDIFDKAFSGLTVEGISDNGFKNFAIGMQLTQKELHKTLEKFGVKTISPLKEKFNPNFHEALLSKEDKSLEDGTIFEVSEKGYTLNERLLRPAKVCIIKNNTEE